MASVNGDGTEKIPLVFIGNSKMPKLFRGQTGSELGFNYHVNSKAWMNSGIFWNSLKNLIHLLGELEVEKHF